MVEHQPEQQRFQVTRGTEVAHLDYQRQGTQVDFTHTWTPPVLRGQGIAAKLVAAGVAWACDNGLSISASCSYVARWLAKNSA